MNHEPMISLTEKDRLRALRVNGLPRDISADRLAEMIAAGSVVVRDGHLLKIERASARIDGTGAAGFETAQGKRAALLV